MGQAHVLRVSGADASCARRPGRVGGSPDRAPPGPEDVAASEPADASNMTWSGVSGAQPLVEYRRPASAAWCSHNPGSSAVRAVRDGRSAHFCRTDRPPRLGSAALPRCLTVLLAGITIGSPVVCSCGRRGLPSAVPVAGTRRLRLAVRGPVEQLGVLATLSRWRSRVQIPSGPPGSLVRFHWGPS